MVLGLGEIAQAAGGVACGSQQPSQQVPVLHRFRQSLDLHSRACVTEVVRLVREGRTLRPALHQRVVTGIYVEGKSSDQLAAELGIRPGNVRAIAYRTVHEIGCHVRQQHKLQLTAAAIRACLEML